MARGTGIIFTVMPLACSIFQNAGPGKPNKGGCIVIRQIFTLFYCCLQQLIIASFRLRKQYGYSIVVRLSIEINYTDAAAFAGRC